MTLATVQFMVVEASIAGLNTRGTARWGLRYGVGFKELMLVRTFIYVHILVYGGYTYTSALTNLHAETFFMYKYIHAQINIQ